MLEGHVAELLAAYLSRFIENVNADQLQISLWSGNVVLNHVRLRSDVLESITALLYGERSNSEANGAKVSPSAAVDTSSTSSDSHEGGAPNNTFSMRSLLAPFTVVKGVIQQLAITVPWASLESEPVQVQVVGVELVFGPLRARSFNAHEEQGREQAMKQQQLDRYEKERHRLSHQATNETSRQGSSSMTASTEARHVKGGVKSANTGTSVASGASWFSWLLDFDRMSQIALRNVRLTLGDISVRYEFDYEGLHSSCASALCVFVKEAQVTTTDEQFEDVFNKDLLAPLCKRFVLSGVVVSTHAVRRSLHGANHSVREWGDVPMPAAGGEPAAHATAYDLYASRWAHSTAIVRVEKLQVQAKVIPPGCASKNPIVGEAPIHSASSTELTVATVDSIEVDWCFGVVQVLESMWRSYSHSLRCARYRKRLHLLRLTGRHGTQNAHDSQASKLGGVSLSREAVAVSRPCTRQRWSFALRCVLDDVRQHRRTFGLHGQRRCEVVQAMVQFGHLRRAYVEYWKRTKGAIWAPPLTVVEAKKVQSIERQLSLWQVVFLRCLANAQLLVERDGYARQQAFIEEARQRTEKVTLSSSESVSGGAAKSLLWGWLFGNSTDAKHDVTTRSSTPSASITTRGGTGSTSLSVHGVPSLCDMVALEWSLGRRYASPHCSPVVRPSAPRSDLSMLAEESKLYFTLRVRFVTLIVRIDSTYWPLTHDSTVPDPPSTTPLRHLRQSLAIRTRSVELFYTTIPDNRPDKASLSLFIGSASIAFEGVLRSVLLQSKEQFREDYVVLKCNNQCTQIDVWVAPQLLICQPMHEWAWWCAEMSAFAEWFRMVQRVHYASGSAEASPSAISAFTESSPLGLRDAVSASGGTTASCSGAPTPHCQPSQLETEATTSHESPAPLMVNVTIQSLDVCVPLFVRDIDISDLEIFSHQPSAFSSAALMGSLPEMFAPESYTRCGKRDWRFFTEVALDEDDGTDASPDGDANMRGNKGAPSALPLRETGGVRSVSVHSDTDEYNGAESLHSSHGRSVSIFASSTPARYFLNNESCLVLSVSTTRLWTVAPAMKRHKGTENEYYLCIGDHSKAVRLFCQNGYNANTLITSQQLELLSFVAGEVLLNPKELTVLFKKGINAVADPTAFALVNDGLLKPTVFADAGENGQVVRAVTAELQQAECRRPSVREPAVPWQFRSSTCVELRSEFDSAPVLREVPHHCARYIISALSATFSIAPSRATTVAGAATPSTEVATDVFGGRVLTVGVGVARLLIRSEENVDLAELVLVAPEHLPSTTAPYREALAALGAEEPRAIELMCDLTGSQLNAVDRRSCNELPLCPPKKMACPRFLLSIPDITMTTAAGRKLLNVENLTVVKSPSTSRRSETVLAVQTVSAFCDLVLVQILEVLIGTVSSMRPMTLPPLAAGFDPMGASRNEAVASEMQHRFFGGGAISARVQTTRLQIPLSQEDVADAPYVEVTVSVEDVLCTLDPFTDDTDRIGQRVHLQFTVSEAMQLADYVGGDPEVRSLISAHPWKTSCCDDSTSHPLRCLVEVMLPGACIEGTATSASTRTAALPSTTCRVTTVGGTVHVYFPFLYFYAGAMKTDERIVRLGELARSPLLCRGHTHVPSLAESTQGARAVGNAHPSPEKAPMALLLEATISDLNAMLATDAAVPIDVDRPDTMAVVHVERIVCGLRQTLSDSPGAPHISKTRTHAFVDTTGVQLLDAFAATRDVSLPNMRLRAEMGVLLEPKEDLTGYAYQPGAPEDWTLLVGVHPATAPLPHRAAPFHQEANSIVSHPSDVTINLSAQQFHSLTSFFLRNFFQLPIPSSRRRPICGGGNLRHVLGVQPTVTVQIGGDTAPSLCRHSADAPASKQAPLPPAVTLLLTIPAVSLVVSADDCITGDKSARRPTTPRSDKEREMKSSTPAVLPSPPPSLPSARHGSYQVSLRRGAQLYSATGGRWFTSPVKSGQLSGVELLAREEKLESSAGHMGTPETEAAHLLLTVDAVSLTLVEQRAGPALDTADDHVSNKAAVVKVSAVVRHAHFRVPHIKWWLQLYNMLASAYSTDAGGEGTNAHMQGPSGTVGNAASFRDIVQNGNEWISGQGSSTSGGQLLTSRGGYVDEDKATWLKRYGHLAWRPHDSHQFHGTVEILHTKACLFTVDSTSRNQQPWCQLTVAEAKMTACPGLALYEGVREHMENAECVPCEFVLEVPRCPELLFLRISEKADGAAGLEPHHSFGSCYASVLRRQPVQVPYTASCGPDVKSSNWRQPPAATTELASQPPRLSAHSNEMCLSLRLLCSPDAGSSTTLRCGRCYYVTDLTLHRTSTVHVRLQHVFLEIPAVPLFSLLRELLRQAAETQSVAEVRPPSRTLPHDGRNAESMARTHIGLKAEVTDVEVRLIAGPTPLGDLTASHDVGSGLASCSVAVDSARLTTSLQLQNVFTSTRKTAAIIGDELSGEWRVQIWHMIPQLVVQGVVLSTTSGTLARWPLPDMRIKASLPLTRRVICVRAQQATGVEDEVEHSFSSDDTVRRPRIRSTANFCQVEPAVSAAFNRLHYHVLASVDVDVGPKSDDAVGEAPGPKAPVQVCLPTVFTLASVAARLIALWHGTQRTCEPSAEAAVSSHATESNTGWRPHSAQRHLGLLTWYEFKLCMSGRRVEVALDTPAAMVGDKTTSALKVDSDVCISVDGAITVQVDREVAEDAGEETCMSAVMRNGAENDKDKWSSRVDDENAVVAAAQTLFRLRTGPLYVHDGAGILLLHVSEDAQSAVTNALITVYAPAETRLHVNVGQVVVHVSSLTAVLMVRLWKAYSAWEQRWESTAAFLSRPATCLHEAKSKAESMMGSENSRQSGWLQNISAEVSHTELLLAPAARLCARRAHMTRSPANVEASIGAAASLELRCEEACLYTMMPQSAAVSETESTVLGRTLSPELVVVIAQQQTVLLQYRTPLVSIMNRDGHSWPMCALRAANALSGMMAAATVGADIASQEESASAMLAEGPAPSWVMWIPRAEIDVSKVELLCFAPSRKRTVSAAPAVCLVARQAVLRLLYSESLDDSGNTETTAGSRLRASAVLSATCHGGASTDVQSHCLLDDATTTFLLSSSSRPTSGPVEVTLSAAAAPGKNAVSFHVPTGDTLESMMAALWLLARAQAPRRYVPARAEKRSSAPGAEVSGRAGTLWHVRADVPRVLLHFLLAETAFPIQVPTLPILCSICMDDIHAEMCIRRGEEGARPRPFVAVRVSSIVGETVLTDATDAISERVMEIPWKFLVIRPVEDSSGDSPPCKVSATGGTTSIRGGSSSSNSAGFSVVQRSLSLSKGGEEGGKAASYVSADDTTALVVRLHTLHAHPSMTLLKLLMERVLRPSVTGISAAGADARATHIFEMLEYTVLRVDSAAAMLPTVGSVNRHTGQVRVVEVVNDWDLCNDLRLGGEGGFQLHFRGTADRSVITVRGGGGGGTSGAGSTKDQGSEATIVLSLPVGANGEIYPAIRVDPDLTARFENVRVVLGEETLSAINDAFALEEFVELGERSLCLLPLPLARTYALPVVVATAAPTVGTAASASADAGETVTNTSVPPETIVSSWVVSAILSADVAVGFDVSLTAGARRLAATGGVTARYRFEEKRDSVCTRCSGHEGECSMTLHTCVSESGPLTTTPVSATAQLSFSADENRLRVVLNAGSTVWWLPLGHAHALIELGRLAQQALYRPPLPPLPQRSWHPRVTGGTWAHGPTRRPTTLDVRADVPSWALTLTNDTGGALAVLLVEHVRLQYSTDVDFADAALTAEASVSLRDCIEFDHELDEPQDAPARYATKGPSAASSPTAKAGRVLFSAQPRVSVSFTRFCPGSRSLSVSVHIDDVVATLPLVTAVRLLQFTAREMNAGKRVFWNDSGVEIEVTEPVPSVSASHSSVSRWRLPSAPGRLVRTSIPVSSAVLMLTPVESSASGTSSTAVQKDGKVSSGAALSIQALGSSGVCRMSLPGYASALGALDLVVQKIVREGMEVVHLRTSVVLVNVFYAGTAEGSGAAPLTARMVTVTADCARLMVPPRSARYIPLPILRECLTLEFGDCMYAPVAKMLTWAMVADAMTAVADQAAGYGGGGSGEPWERGTAAGLMLHDTLFAQGKDSAENGSESRAPALCGRVRVLDAFTLTFPMLLCPALPTLVRPLRGASTGESDSGAALAAAADPQSQASVSHTEGVSGTGRVVQLTWRRRCSQKTTSPFSGRLVPSDYTVAVEPVWTLWNWTGCRLRLRLRTSRSGVVGSRLKAPHPTPLPPSTLLTGSSGSDVVAVAALENGVCFQWTPATLDVLQEEVFAFFQLMAPTQDDSTAVPSLPSSTQWWSVAAPLSLQEQPPPYIRLQQCNGVTRGALRVEQHGPSNVVLRCAALLRSVLTRPVYLRDADQLRPLLGSGAHGCVLPQQQVPLFYSEYVTTLAPKTDRVGFKVVGRPVTSTGASAAAAQETEAYYVTSPVVAKLLSVSEQTDRTCFYTVSGVPDVGFERPADVLHRKDEKNDVGESLPAQGLSFLWTPEPLAVLQLCSLCRIRNTDLDRTLLVMPFDAPAESNTEGTTTAPRMITPVPPGEERGVTEFSPHATEPEVQFCYTTSGGRALAHMWSPPVRLLSLATSTQPLVLKHTCIPHSSQGVGTEGPTENFFTMNPVLRRTRESVALTVDHFRCLTVQSSMTSVSLCVSVGLQAVPPVKIVNRLKTTLHFAQCALVKDSDLASSPTRSDIVRTASCSRTARPRIYVVAAESMSYGCWEVPALEAPGLRLTLYSNVCKGVSVSHDVDLLRCAASPWSGARVGNTDVYVYVSLDHRLQQYTVTVAPSRQLECRMLFQSRRLTQLEVYVHSCTVYVAAITVPTAGSFARKSLIALGCRGRMRLHRGARGDEGVDQDTVPPHATDEDVLTFLKEQELDVVLVRLLGFYGTTTVTERHLMGSASLALLEVVDCTTVEAAYPVLLRVGPRADSASATAFEGTAVGEHAAKVEGEGGSALIVPDSPGGTAAVVAPTSVPRFKDSSWLSVEVHLTRPEEAAAADGVVIFPVPQLRVAVPLIVVRADDDFLFTVRTTAERLSEEWAAAAPGVIDNYAVERQGSLTASSHAVVGDTAMHPSRAYHVFVYVLRISPIVAEVTYTRSGHRLYNPFEGLARIPENLIPSVEGLSVSLKEVKLGKVELRSSHSLFGIAWSFLWPLYRTQLLLQSYKIVGSLDVLGNPRALLGSWSRGVWDLFTNSAGQSRWAGTREFLRTTTSSTLHSVGMVARSIGNLVGTSPPAVAPRVSYGSSFCSVSGGAVLSTLQRRSVLGEVLYEVGGSISDAVTKPIRGAREGGVGGFLIGIAAGVVGLAGRPVFGFFRGVSATSEFYARLLGGLGELTELEARRLGLERNYRVMFTSVTGVPASLETKGLKEDTARSAAETSMHILPRAPRRRLLYLLTHAMYDQVFIDVPGWRRGEEANVRLAVDRVGIYNTALHTPYAALSSFFSPSEFRAALPCALTAFLANKLISCITHNSTYGACQGTAHADEHGVKAHVKSDTGEDQTPRGRQTHEYAWASYIKDSLGVRALQEHVTDQLFVRVCSLAEMEAFVTAPEAQQKYSVALVSAMSAALEHLLAL